MRWLCLVSILLSATPAAAQLALPAPGEPLEPRQAARSGYAPQGVRLGVVHLYPEAEVARSYRQEIFPDIEGLLDRSGWVTEVTARVGVEATAGPWAVQARGDVGRADGLTALVGDGLEGGGSAQLRLGLGRWAVAELEAGWERRHERRATPAVSGEPTRPVPVRSGFGALALRTEHGRLTTGARLEVARSTFGDVPRRDLAALPSLATVNNGDRDRLATSLAAEAAWRPGGLSSVYVRGTLGRVDYLEETDDSGHRRDTDTRSAFVGVSLGRPETWRVFLEVGHLSRFGGDDPRLADAAALAVNAGATVAVTPLITAQLVAETALAETTVPGSPATVVRRGRLEIEHEVLRTVVLLTTAEAEWHDYAAIDRDDMTFAYGSGARWRLGPLLRVEMMVEQETFAAGEGLDSYEAMEASLRLAARF